MVILASINSCQNLTYCHIECLKVSRPVSDDALMSLFIHLNILYCIDSLEMAIIIKLRLIMSSILLKTVQEEANTQSV